MDESVLLLEVGSGPISELSSAELAAILSAYTNAQVMYAAVKTFDILRKNFQPSYRMGKTYVAESDKYEFYNKMFNDYVAKASAGALGHTDFTPNRSIDRWKWVKDSHPKDSDAS